MKSLLDSFTKKIDKYLKWKLGRQRKNGSRIFGLKLKLSGFHSLSASLFHPLIFKLGFQKLLKNILPTVLQ
jgi:hypothetical protein